MKKIYIIKIGWQTKQFWNLPFLCQNSNRFIATNVYIFLKGGFPTNSMKKKLIKIRWTVENPFFHLVASCLETGRTTLPKSIPHVLQLISCRWHSSSFILHATCLDCCLSKLNDKFNDKNISDIDLNYLYNKVQIRSSCSVKDAWHCNMN